MDKTTLPVKWSLHEQINLALAKFPATTGIHRQETAKKPSIRSLMKRTFGLRWVTIHGVSATSNRLWAQFLYQRLKFFQNVIVFYCIKKGIKKDLSNYIIAIKSMLFISYCSIYSSYNVNCLYNYIFPYKILIFFIVRRYKSSFEAS